MTSPYIDIGIQSEDFSNAQCNEFDTLADNTSVGAVVSFVGKVRQEQHPQSGALVALEIEQYPGMTEQSLRSICIEAVERWSVIACRAVHRVGRLTPGDNIVLVSAASAHRADAFAASEFIMDFLKTQAPLWKKAVYEKSEHWVQARESDQRAANKWRAHK